MRYRPTILYTQPLSDTKQRLDNAIARGLERCGADRPIPLFFRADDIGVPSAGFLRLIRLFQHFHLPLCLAVVPSWLTVRRYGELRSITGHDDTLWCWHQHGRRHRNFEVAGKKQEFGPARTREVLLSELRSGLDRLQTIMGESVSPFFTPPWNRLSMAAAEALRELGFLAISRSAHAQPDVSAILPDIQVNVDLHTRKEASAEQSFAALLHELEEGLATGHCGIMIHHQRMNRRAFRLLEQLLATLAGQDSIRPLRFEGFLDEKLFCTLPVHGRSRPVTPVRDTSPQEDC